MEKGWYSYRGSLAYTTFGPRIKLQEKNFAEAKYLAYAIFGLSPLKNPKDCSSEDRIIQGPSVVANLIY